jgi:protein gp37
MPTKTKIEWTDYTSNPIRFRAPDGRVVWACEKVSAGCTHCYAEALSRRYTQRRAGEWNAATMATLRPFLDDKELHALLHMKSLAGKRVFIGDMTDIFGEWVPDELLDRLFAVFALRSDVTFQVLTKRAHRMHKHFTADPDSLTERVEEHLWAMHTDYTTNSLPINPWPLPNVWLGVSCEDQQRADERIPLLLQTPAAVRFVSAEPLIGPIEFTYNRFCRQMGWGPPDPPRAAKGERPDTWVLRPGGIDWVIVGGESGPSARPCDVTWIRSIVQQCHTASVPVFVKQLGAEPFDSGAVHLPVDVMSVRHSKGGDPSEWPEDLRVRQFPSVETRS